MCIRDRSYARAFELPQAVDAAAVVAKFENGVLTLTLPKNCLLYTSDAADERSSVDLGGRRIIKTKK